jgi:hypothetical protein
MGRLVVKITDIKKPCKNRGLINLYSGGIEAHLLLSAPLALSVLVSFETDEEPNRVKSGGCPFAHSLFLSYEVFF